jgi:antitoxin CptB
MAPQKAAGEDIAMRRRRLRYRAAHRGTRELDLILGPYADAHVEAAGEVELDRFEQLLEEADTDLQKWLLRQEPPPHEADRDLIDAILLYKLSRPRP